LAEVEKHDFLTYYTLPYTGGDPSITAMLGKSARKDVRDNYSGVVLCNKCATTSSRQVRLCFFSRFESLSQHLLQHHASCAGSPVTKEIAVSAATPENVRLTLSLLFAGASMPDMHVKKFCKLMGPHISVPPVPAQHRVSSVDVAAAAEAQYQAMMRLVQDEPFVAVSFDGGRWIHRGEYLMVTVVHAPNRAFVLRPASRETAFDGAAIAGIRGHREGRSGANPARDRRRMHGQRGRDQRLRRARPLLGGNGRGSRRRRHW
jgi:hypothetical protein